MVAAVAALVLLKGSVTIGPLTPVCRVGTPCSGPAPHVVLTFTSSTRSFHTTTGAGGAYRLKLPPGAYTVSASKGMRITPPRVILRAGTVHLHLAIDTGIR